LSLTNQKKAINNLPVPTECYQTILCLYHH
jgi:hypothetical protein